MLCSGSALARNDSYSNIPSENAQTSTQHWRSDDPVLTGPKTHRGNVYPPLVSSTCGQRGLLLTNSVNLQSAIFNSILNLQSAGCPPELQSRRWPGESTCIQAIQAHRAPHCRHVLSRARCMVHLYPPSFTGRVEYGHANEVVSSGPSLPLRSGVVHGCVPSHPVTVPERRRPSSASSVSQRGLIPRRLRSSTEQEQPRRPDSTGICRILSIPHSDNDSVLSVKLQGPVDTAARAGLLGN